MPSLGGPLEQSINQQPALPAAASLRDDERGGVLHRVEILGQELTVGDRDAELLLEERDELQHARRVDDAALEERLIVRQALAVLTVEKVGNDEFLMSCVMVSLMVVLR